jgi:hypothetical protein
MQGIVISQVADQRHPRMDHSQSNVIPIEEAFSQAQLQLMTSASCDSNKK